MNRIDAIFADLRSVGRPAFMPFLTAGYPDRTTTSQLIEELDRRGAHLLELGMPFSDSIADGPTIQTSFTHVLRSGLRVSEVFDLVARVRPRVRLALVSMVSYSIVWRRGPAQYLDDCRRVGIDGLIVPDLPLEESGELAAAAAQRDLKVVHLAAPTTPEERLRRIAERTSGFLYYMSVTGITGERDRLPESLMAQLRHLKRFCPVPVCVGFGISRPEQVRMLRPVADGIIVGSALVRRITEGLDQPRERLIQSIGEYAAQLIAATHD